MKIIAAIKSEFWDITEEGDIEDLLGVNIDKVESEKYHMSHPQIINQIVSNLGL